MSEILETVKVKHENGFMIINKSDFDGNVHVLFEDKPKSTRQQKPEPKD